MDEHASDEGSTPKLDVFSIEFPTDIISVRDLIDQFPDAFAWYSDARSRRFQPEFDPFEPRHKALATLRLAMGLERELAELAFLRHGEPTFQTGIPDDDVLSFDGEMTRGELIEGLDEEYRALGLTSGPKQTAEFVRRIESQAARQACNQRST